MLYGPALHAPNVGYRTTSPTTRRLAYQQYRESFWAVDAENQRLFNVGGLARVLNQWSRRQAKMLVHLLEAYQQRETNEDVSVSGTPFLTQPEAFRESHTFSENRARPSKEPKVTAKVIPQIPKRTE